MRGFTLIELIVVMAVAAILLGIAMPSFRSFVQNSRLATQANSLVYSLNLARSEAIKLDTQVEVCASSDGLTCNVGGTPPGFAAGWIVCYPVVANACAAVGATPLTVLQVSPALGPTGNPNTVTEQVNNSTFVVYQSNGQTNQGAVVTTYRFVFCDNRLQAFGQDVEINSIGRIESAQVQGQNVIGGALGGC
jgi:prepilin-type N-terminal cleavage/methylation domain-containing protein